MRQCRGSATVAHAHVAGHRREGFREVPFVRPHERFKPVCGLAAGVADHPACLLKVGEDSEPVLATVDGTRNVPAVSGVDSRTQLRRKCGEDVWPQTGCGYLHVCLLYTSDAADDLLCVDLG